MHQGIQQKKTRTSYIWVCRHLTQKDIHNARANQSTDLPHSAEKKGKTFNTSKVQQVGRRKTYPFLDVPTLNTEGYIHYIQVQESHIWQAKKEAKSSTPARYSK